MSEEETARIHAALQMRLRELDRIISQAGQAVASYLNYPAYVAASGTKRLTVRRFDLIAVDGGQNIVVLMFSNNRVKSQLFHVRLPLEAEELALLSGLLNDRFTDRSAGEMGIQLMEWTERLAPAAFLFLSQIVSYACDVMEEQQRRIFTAGAKELLRMPEFRDVEKAHALMSILSDGKESLPVPEDGKPMQILIGPENITDALKDASVVIASYEIGEDMRGLIGVVGPTRMDYATVAAKLAVFAQAMTRLFGTPPLPPKEEANE